MKIKRITLKNVTSYKNETVFSFDNRLNILIGPNGGGKSNLQKILAVILSSYFIHQYDFRVDANEARIEPIDLWNKRVLQQNLDRYFDDDSDQIISLELIPEKSDVQNIKLIANNLDAFNEQLAIWESPRESYPPIDFVDDIEATESFTYRIENFELVGTEDDTPAAAFREYLRTFFIFMRLSNKLKNIPLTSPVFFFFSDRTTNKNTSIQTSQMTDQNYYSGYRNVYQAAMGEDTDLFQWGMQHFVRLYWKALNISGNKKDYTAYDIMEKEPDVINLDKYLSKLGYDWGIATDVDSVAYKITLKKGEHAITSEKFSSGEREIVHFLLALFALNVRDGLILVDEPELHLHPRWQSVFLQLFRDLAPDRNNQFIIATHSPVFVTQDTVDSITRIYGSESGSQKVALNDVELPEKRSLVRMINSHNNERLFFADKVVLVEGITDRLIISSLIDGAAIRFLNNEAIEVIEVGGKHNFQQYLTLLDNLDTPTHVVSDQDYPREIGSENTKKLFVRKSSKAWKSLAKDKKSKDAAKLLELLEVAIDEGKTDKLKEFLGYLKERHVQIKNNLSEEEQALIKENIIELQQKNTWVLSAGEIEDYLPDDISDLDEIIEMLEDNNWIVGLKNEARRNELIEITCAILGAGEEEKEQLQKDAATGKEVFSIPIKRTRE